MLREGKYGLGGQWRWSRGHLGRYLVLGGMHAAYLKSM